MVKRLIIYSILLLLAYYPSVCAQGQTILITPEIPPSFPGGEKELYCFIDRNLDKELLRTVDTTGMTWVQFTINTNGKVTDIKIVKSLTQTVDNELLRIIKLMPDWEPGKIGDKAVETKFTVPLKIPYENKFYR